MHSHEATEDLLGIIRRFTVGKSNESAVNGNPGAPLYLNNRERIAQQTTKSMVHRLSVEQMNSLFYFVARTDHVQRKVKWQPSRRLEKRLPD